MHLYAFLFILLLLLSSFFSSFLFVIFLPLLTVSCPLCFSQVRKFVSKDSAGLRVRSHPSLQSEQIGIVHVNGTITFIDEVIVLRQGENYSLFTARVCCLKGSPLSSSGLRLLVS